MEIKKRMLNRVGTGLIAVLLIVTGCSTEQQKEEAQKLLDKQAQVLEKEQESMENLLQKFRQTRDSLLEEQNQLLQTKQEVESEMNQVDKVRTDLAKTLKAAQVDSLADKKSVLEERLSTLNDSLDNVAAKIRQMDQEKKTLNVKEEQLSDQLGSAREKLVTGITEVDQRLDDIEKQRLVKQQELSLNEQKIILAEKKIQLLNDERNLYLREKNELLRKGADNTELENYNLRISEIEGYIQEENNKIRNAESAITTITAWLADVNALETRLRDMMEQEYSENETIERFTNEEMERLKNEQESVGTEMSRLDSIRKILDQQRERVDRELATVDEEMSVVRDKDLSGILAERSALEEEEAQLSEEEAALMNESAGASGSSVSGLPDSELLGDLEQEIRERRSSIETLKSEIAREQQELAQKKAEIEERRSKAAGAVGITAIVLVIAGLLIIAVFYFIGRRNKKA
jgi:predicted  nucleic acid-binding Zn-ribbon protein